MSLEKIEKLAQLLSGLKAYEWSRVKVAVEKMYSSVSAKIELNDTEEIHKNLELEFKDLLD